VYDLPGALRRVRRTADLSQRELARLVGVSKSCIGAAESGSSGFDVRVLARAAALAGLRLALLDPEGCEIEGMAEGTVRDGAARRFPAHLDTRYSDERWWHGPHRYDRIQPWYTFDRDRRTRDTWRERTGMPEDHQVPGPGDSPRDRAERRRRERARVAAEERDRRFLAGEFADVDLRFDCSCPDLCDDLDDRSGEPVHAPECACGCDLA
jgi:transcriptional regulator with XRE-family HTH domain